MFASQVRNSQCRLDSCEVILGGRRNHYETLTIPNLHYLNLDDDGVCDACDR